jgi:hypothetical protein
MRDLPLSKRLERAILDSQSPGIGGMSAEVVVDVLDQFLMLARLRNRVSTIWPPSTASSQAVGGTRPRRFCSARHVTNGERSGHRCQRRRQMGHRGRGHERSSCAAGPGLTAPDLLIAECADILWIKVRRSELSEREAAFAAGLLACADIDLVAMRPYPETAVRIALTSITPPMTVSTSRSPKPKADL